MKRRKFITVVGGMAATWPFAGHAQQSTKLHQIGVLSLGRGDKSDASLKTFSCVCAGIACARLY